MIVPEGEPELLEVPFTFIEPPLVNVGVTVTEEVEYPTEPEYVVFVDVKVPISTVLTTRLDSLESLEA
mgnify:CR=1 FL=1